VDVRTFSMIGTELPKVKLSMDFLVKIRSGDTYVVGFEEKFKLRLYN
jgi:hypothetical protein